MIARKESLLHDAILRHLMDESAEYVDKTDSGGGLYFFDERIAGELLEKGYDVHFAANGTKGTSGRPAWYVTMKQVL